MYKSINVHIENGNVILDEPLTISGNAKGILTIIQDSPNDIKKKVTGKKLEDVLSRIRKNNPFKDIPDPDQWQRDIRKDRDF